MTANDHDEKGTEEGHVSKQGKEANRSGGIAGSPGRHS
jgi:hypothetical protein